MDANMLADYQAMMNEVSRQMAASKLSRRQSRSSSVYSGNTSRRSARIEKPRSIHNSPRATERRRTIASTMKPQNTPDHAYNTVYDHPVPDLTKAWHDANVRSNRPVSWHPGSTQRPTWHHTPTEEFPPAAHNFAWPSSQQPPLQNPDLTLDNDTYASFSSNIPFIERPVSGYHSDFDYSSHNLQPQLDSSSVGAAWTNIPDVCQSAQYQVPAYQPLDVDITPWSVQEWLQMTKMEPSITSQQIADDYLPIQHPSMPTEDAGVAVIDNSVVLDSAEKDDGKELVGMGLYDPPEINTSWLMRDFHGGEGKGLKLEETWQPPEQNDDEEDDDEDAEEEDDADDDEEEDEDEEDDDGDGASSAEESVGEVLPASPQAWPFPPVPVNLSGQSFFFEDDELASGNLWMQQLKQSSHGEQEAKLEYGWS